MATTNKTIADAIAHSKSEGCCEEVEMDGDSNQALAEIRRLVDCDIGHTMHDRLYADGGYRPLLNVWGFRDNTPAGEVEWRLAISFVDSHEE